MAPPRALFHNVFAPAVAREEESQGAFVRARHQHEVRVQVADRAVVQPASNAALILATWLARLHHGKVTLYAAYVLIALVVATLAATLTRACQAMAAQL